MVEKKNKRHQHIALFMDGGKELKAALERMIKYLVNDQVRYKFYAYVDELASALKNNAIQGIVHIGPDADKNSLIGRVQHSYRDIVDFPPIVPIGVANLAEITQTIAQMNKMLKTKTESYNLAKDLENLVSSMQLCKTRPLTVLIIDDRPEMVQEMIVILTRWPGINVFHEKTVNFNKALYQYDIILLDHDLGNRQPNGRTVYEKITKKMKSGSIIAGISSSPQYYLANHFAGKSEISQDSEKALAFIKFMNSLIAQHCYGKWE